MINAQPLLEWAQTASFPQLPNAMLYQIEGMAMSTTCVSTMRLQLFRDFLARNSESLLGFPTILRWVQCSLWINRKRIVVWSRIRAFCGMSTLNALATGFTQCCVFLL